MKRHRLLVVALTATLAGTAGNHPAQAQVEKLGRVDFPSSCSATVQPQFDRALALLHSLWFAPAIKGFSDVAKAAARAHGSGRCMEPQQALATDSRQTVRTSNEIRRGLEPSVN